jgi:cell division protein FtsB
VLIPLVVILLFVIRGTWSIYGKNRSSLEELNLAEDRLARLQEKETELSGMIKKLNTESGVEGEIRERFQMAKEGEQEVVIVEPPESEKTAGGSSESSFWQKIRGFFSR